MKKVNKKNMNSMLDIMMDVRNVIDGKQAYQCYIVLRMLANYYEAKLKTIDFDLIEALNNDLINDDLAREFYDLLDKDVQVVVDVK